MQYSAELYSKLTFVSMCYDVVWTLLDDRYIAKSFTEFTHFIYSIAAVTTHLHYIKQSTNLSKTKPVSAAAAETVQM